MNKVAAVFESLNSGFVLCISRDSEITRSRREECEDRILKSVLQKGCD